MELLQFVGLLVLLISTTNTLLSSFQNACTYTVSFSLYLQDKWCWFSCIIDFEARILRGCLNCLVWYPFRRHTDKLWSDYLHPTSLPAVIATPSLLNLTLGQHHVIKIMPVLVWDMWVTCLVCMRSWVWSPVPHTHWH
jgi:hypothetical protein